MFRCCFFHLFLAFHLVEKVKIVFLLLFCIFFWSQFTKNTYTFNGVPILRLKSRMKLLHFFFFREFTFGSFSFTFFLGGVCVNIIRKYWENSLNSDPNRRNLHFCSGKCAGVIAVEQHVFVNFPSIELQSLESLIFNLSRKTLCGTRDTHSKTSTTQIRLILSERRDRYAYPSKYLVLFYLYVAYVAFFTSTKGAARINMLQIFCTLISQIYCS